MNISSPLTERVLQWLGRPRWLWMSLWTVLSFLVIELPYRFLGLRAYPGLPYALLSAYTNFVCLIGLRSLWQTINDIQQPLAKLGIGTSRRPFDPTGSVVGPLLLSCLLTAVVWSLPDFVRYREPITAWIFPVQYIAWLPANTALWVYGVIVAGLYHLGRRPLHLRPFEEDRSLGLRPIGVLASRGILLLSVTTIPLAVAGLHDPRSFVVILTIYVVGTLLMFIALWHIHGQMLAVKAHRVGQCRSLVAEALRPITGAWSVEALQTQAQILAAADQVERRAAAIWEWPFEEAVLARIAAIVTAVIAAIIARLALRSFGL